MVAATIAAVITISAAETTAVPAPLAADFLLHSAFVQMWAEWLLCLLRAEVLREAALQDCWYGQTTRLLSLLQICPQLHPILWEIADAITAFSGTQTIAAAVCTAR